MPNTFNSFMLSSSVRVITPSWWDGFAEFEKINLVSESSECFVMFPYWCIFACWLPSHFDTADINLALSFFL
jgi:hypothetical protein